MLGGMLSTFFNEHDRFDTVNTIEENYEHDVYHAFSVNQNDSLYGQDGNDSIEGGAKSDYVFGGNDLDSVYGGAFIDGESGYAISSDFDTADTIFGENGADSLFGGRGGDSIQGGAGLDVIKATHDKSTADNNSNNDGAVDNMWTNTNGTSQPTDPDTVAGTRLQDKKNDVVIQ